MPIGSHHDETGILVRDGDPLYLQRDAGGHSQINAPDKAMKLLGRRVRIVGVRTGFDRLSARQNQPHVKTELATNANFALSCWCQLPRMLRRHDFRDRLIAELKTIK